MFFPAAPRTCHGRGPHPAPLAGRRGAAGPRGRGGPGRARAGPSAAPRPRLRELPLPIPAGSRPAPPRRLDGPGPAGGPRKRTRHTPPGAGDLLTAQTPRKSLQRSPAALNYSPLVFNDVK